MTGGGRGPSSTAPGVCTQMLGRSQNPLEARVRLGGPCARQRSRARAVSRWAAASAQRPLRASRQRVPIPTLSRLFPRGLLPSRFGLHLAWERSPLQRHALFAMANEAVGPASEARARPACGSPWKLSGGGWPFWRRRTWRHISDPWGRVVVPRVKGQGGPCARCVGGRQSLP